MDKRTKKINTGWVDGLFSDEEATEMKFAVEKDKARLEGQIATFEGENLNLKSKLS